MLAAWIIGVCVNIGQVLPNATLNSLIPEYRYMGLNLSRPIRQGEPEAGTKQIFQTNFKFSVEIEKRLRNYTNMLPRKGSASVGFNLGSDVFQGREGGMNGTEGCLAHRGLRKPFWKCLTESNVKIPNVTKATVKL